MIPNLKIRTNARIQKAVDDRQGSKISRFAAEHRCAVSFEEQHGIPASSYGIRDFAYGVTVAAKLFQKLLKEYERRRKAINLGGDETVKGLGVYVATQSTGDGPDHLYFIGTPSEILDNLRSVPASKLKPEGVS